MKHSRYQLITVLIIAVTTLFVAGGLYAGFAFRNASAGTDELDIAVETPHLVSPVPSFSPEPTILPTPTPAPTPTSVSNLSGGISGKVIVKKGNCMPGPDDPRGMPCKISGESRTVYIYRPVTSSIMDGTYLSGQAELVTSRSADKDGNYIIDLPAGTYSVFVEDHGKRYCNDFQDPNKACQVTVVKGKYTVYEITVSSDATF